MCDFYRLNYVNRIYKKKYVNEKCYIVYLEDNSSINITAIL